MRINPLHLVDVFVCVVVLNLTAQVFPQVLVESFAVSLLTAVMLTAALELVLWVKKRILGRLRSASTVLRRVVNIILLVLLLPGSKFVVLWLESLLFGDAVSLGGFWSVTLLVLTLTGARFAVRWLLEPRESAPDPVD